ncbi:substrate-binding periplasmic protein [Kordiimonas gwangyangensis]|uniref:substrate-binding periplasmic protein n=1 Tax=Kordiimonas gwangyangensis TaxID=288022 RepID=UPI0003A52882|nr:transporter substrate-binding domain-containing protein [Kordiimonas gwangyangensis]
MTKRVASHALVLPFLMLAGLWTAASAADRCDEIVATGHPDYVPFSWKSGDSLDGASVDIAKLIAHKLGKPIRVVHSGSWKRAQAAVFTGEVDLLLALYFTEARAERLYYTSPVTSEPVVAITLTDTDLHYRKREDLEGFQGGKVIGDSFGDELDAYASKSLKLHTVPTVEHLLNLLDHKRIQYAVHGLYPVLVTAHKMGMGARVRTLIPPLTQETSYMAISKRSPCVALLETISAEVESMRATGVVDSFLKSNWDKWARSENTGVAPPPLPKLPEAEDEGQPEKP